MFRSPTCTLSDKMAAGALALIAGINIAVSYTHLDVYKRQNIYSKEKNKRHTGSAFR